MNKKIIWGIVIAVVVIGGAVYIMKQRNIPRGTLTLMSPNGGEMLKKEKTQVISWRDDMYGCPGAACPNNESTRSYIISLSAYPNGNKYDISTYLFDTAPYDWVVGKILTPSSTPSNSKYVEVPNGQYVITVCSSLTCDSSDNYFTITD